MPSNGSGSPKIGTKWASGTLEFFDRADGDLIATFAPGTNTLAIPSGAVLDVSAGTVTGALGVGSVGLLNLSAATAETAAATTTVDVTKTYHRIATDGANFSGAINCAASAAGNDGDILITEFDNAASDGTTTVTFTTNFKPSATLAVLQSKYGSVTWISNGTTWHEINRSAIITS